MALGRHTLERRKGGGLGGGGGVTLLPVNLNLNLNLNRTKHIWRQKRRKMFLHNKRPYLVPPPPCQQRSQCKGELKAMNLWQNCVHNKTVHSHRDTLFNVNSCLTP